MLGSCEDESAQSFAPREPSFRESNRNGSDDSVRAAKEVIGGNVERHHEPQDGPKSYLAPPALDARHLDGGKPRAVRELLLCPSACLARFAHIAAEAFERALHTLDPGSVGLVLPEPKR
jgi:hypothetical protein